MRSLPGSSTLDLTTRVNGGVRPEELLADIAALPAVQRIERIEDGPQDSGPPTQPAGIASQPAEDTAPTDFRVRLYVDGDAPNLVAPAATLLADRGLVLTGVELGTPTLEDVFIHLTGRSLR
jgi:ABC-2 type transport system ATP-binding protein